MTRRGMGGQSTAEYVILISVVLAATVAMQMYVKRGLQGKVKDVTDNVGFGLKDAGFTALTNQYEPYYAVSDFNVSQKQSTKTSVTDGYKVSRVTDLDETKRTGVSKQEVDLSKDNQWLAQ
ncbi:MAG: hypothetical protein HY596_01170 [Candidatus Omnitrophica bacterium]|nr:hypothetical protein [Candidatus Omnitrophota bacterium]